MIRSDSHGRTARAPELSRAWPLLGPGVVGVVSGGLIAAAVARAPTPAAVWLAAYLVLVVGVAQIALALGQAVLVEPAAGSARIRLESVLFNAGSAGVIAGVLAGTFPLVLLGTVVFLGALGAFLAAVHGRGGYATHAYRALIALLAISAVIGVLLATSSA